MKILKYNIKKPERSLNDYYFYYKSLTRKERRTKMVLTSCDLIPIRKYYMSIDIFRVRQYNERMEKYNLLCAQKRNHLIKSIHNNL